METRRHGFIVMQQFSVSPPVILGLILPCGYEIAADPPSGFMLVAYKPMSLADVQMTVIAPAYRTASVEEIIHAPPLCDRNLQSAKHSNPYAKNIERGNKLD